MSELNYKKYEPIDGKWYIKDKLGEGSYGAVYRIERDDISGKQEAALKIITIPKNTSELAAMRDSLGDEKSVTEYYEGVTRKLISELKLMSELKGNSNIVSYEDHNIFEHEDGIGYDVLIRMEILKPLTKVIDNSMNETQVVKIGIDICKALEACQKFNIVHRDIKPENIFISKTGEYKLGDFGVSKTMNSSETVMTKTGTYTYMAPELYKGEPSGTNVDIYSLGMVMYRLLNCNREPFLPLPPKGFTFEQKEEALLRRMKGEEIPKPMWGEGRLAEIVLKACSYNPKDRYESPLQMREELENILGNSKCNANISAQSHVDVDKSIVENNKDGLTAGVFQFNVPKTDDEGTEGIFATSLHQNDNIVEMDKDRDKVIEGTVGIFGKLPDKKTDQCAVVLKRKKQIYFASDYAIDIYENGQCIASDIKDFTYWLKLTPGVHNIRLVLKNIINYKKDITITAPSEIEYGFNRVTGGIKIFSNTSSGMKKKETTLKSKKVALALAIIPYTGWFGVHDFYLGKIGMGLLKLCTLNFFCIGWIVDIILIATRKYKNKDGSILD